MISISAHRPEFNKTENANRMANLCSDLLSLIGFDAKLIPAIGSFKGIKEDCFVIRVKDDATDETLERIADGVMELAGKYQQEGVGGIDEDADIPTMIYIPTEYDEEYITVSILEVSDTEPDTDYLLFNAKYYSPGRDITWLKDYIEMTEE